MDLAVMEEAVMELAVMNEAVMEQAVSELAILERTVIELRSYHGTGYSEMSICILAASETPVGEKYLSLR
jgi:hypothetical protein